VLKSVRRGDIADTKVKGWLARVLDLRYLNGKKKRYLWAARGRSENS
jgi:hypothetical protein